MMDSTNLKREALTRSYVGVLLQDFISLKYYCVYIEEGSLFCVL